MAMTVCSCTGCAAHVGSCPTLVAKGRCTPCASQAERGRGSRQQRGYDREHELIRAELIRTLKPGTPCPRCDKPMQPGQPLDAGHSVDLRDNPSSRADRLEHAGCNRAWRRQS
jgi:hypothetical protein